MAKKHIDNGNLNFVSFDCARVIKFMFLFFCSAIKKKAFQHVKGKVHLGRFVMRSRMSCCKQLSLDSINALPTAYEKGEYFAFLKPMEPTTVALVSLEDSMN